MSLPSPHDWASALTDALGPFPRGVAAMCDGGVKSPRPWHVSGPELTGKAVARAGQAAAERARIDRQRGRGRREPPVAHTRAQDGLLPLGEHVRMSIDHGLDRGSKRNARRLGLCRYRVDVDDALVPSGLPRGLARDISNQESQPAQLPHPVGDPALLLSPSPDAQACLLQDVGAFGLRQTGAGRLPATESLQRGNQVGDPLFARRLRVHRKSPARARSGAHPISAGAPLPARWPGARNSFRNARVVASGGCGCRPHPGRARGKAKPHTQFRNHASLMGP